jgi:hypothetical protein
MLCVEQDVTRHAAASGHGPEAHARYVLEYSTARQNQIGKARVVDEIDSCEDVAKLLPTPVQHCFVAYNVKTESGRQFGFHSRRPFEAPEDLELLRLNARLVRVYVLYACVRVMWKRPCVRVRSPRGRLWRLLGVHSSTMAALAAVVVVGRKCR